MKRIALTSAALLLFGCGADEPKATPPAPVVEEPLRTVGTRALFGDMPTDNLVLDPQFALLDGVAWLPLGSGWDWPTMVRVHLAATPTGQPALLAAASQVRVGDPVVGSTRSVARPLEVSLWVGRRLRATDLEAAQVSVSIAGVFLDGATESVDVLFDVTSAARVIGDLVWHRFGTTVSEGPVGWANVIVVDGSSDDLFLSAPVVLADTSKKKPAGAARRALRAAERRGMAAIQANLRERFRPPAVDGRAQLRRELFERRQ